MLERWRSGGPQLSREHARELEARLGHPRWVRRLPSSPRSDVWLAEFDGSPAVVKQVVAGSAVRKRVRTPEGTGPGEVLGTVEGVGAQEISDGQERYGREVTALRLAARVHPAVVPSLLATVPAARLLVLERLNDRRPRTGWILPWAVALARLHASTGPADVGSLPAWRGPGPTDARAFLALAAELAVPVPSRVPGELEQLLTRLHPARGHDLLHGDPYPGNDLYENGSARFLDLEAAALGSGLVELAYLRIGFPTCWCVTGVAEAELLVAESAYRQTYRSAAGTEPAGDLVDACAGWLISGDALVERARRGSPGQPADHLAAVLRRDWRWGTATARQRLAHRLGVVGGLCAERDDLSGLGRLCLLMRARMNTRWPGLAPLPLVRPG